MRYTGGILLYRMVYLLNIKKYKTEEVLLVASQIEIFQIYTESFSVNLYTSQPFRMIGLIDVRIKYDYGIERVTLAFYRSSGTNDGKINGLWYPIVGIKTHAGSFTEFTEYLNYVLTNTTKVGRAGDGWLAKSLFFSKNYTQSPTFRGYSLGKHYNSLLEIGETLRDLYENDRVNLLESLNISNLNNKVTSMEIYLGNRRTQRENFEKFVEDIFKEDFPSNQGSNIF